MAKKIQNQIKQKKILERIFFTIINLLILQLVTPFIIILLIINLILVIFQNKRNATIIEIIKVYIKIITETFEFMAFVSDKTPYPFN